MDMSQIGMDMSQTEMDMSPSGLLFLCQIFLGGGKHEFDTVQLVYLAGTGVVVDGHDI